MSSPPFLFLNAVLWLLMVAAVLVIRARSSRAWLVVTLAAILGINAGLHLLGSIVTRTYSPGSVTAALLYIPLVVYALRQVLPWVSRGLAMGAGLLGAAIHAGVMLLAAHPSVLSPLQEHVMRPLRYSINVTLDGCCDHRAIIPDEELHRHAVENLNRADALLFGRVTYEMMEAAFRSPRRTGEMPDWMEPFALTIDAAKKYVVSSTLDRVDWNAEFVRGDLGKAVQRLKQESGKGLLVGGVKLPMALAELGVIDEYEFVVHRRLVGHGPTLFAGLSKYVDLKLVSRLELGSGAVAMRYEPRK